MTPTAFLEQKASWRFMIGLSIFFSIFYFILPDIAQYASYHTFAGDNHNHIIPNIGNVSSNIFYLLAGGIGLYRTHRANVAMTQWRWTFFYSSIILVGLGSSYYHFSPTTFTLFWDRLPMAIGFAALTANFLGEHFHTYQSPQFFWAVQIFSLFSVVYWIISEWTGFGDLKLYAIVQFATMILILTLLIKHPQRHRDGPYWLLFCGYALAKILELGDVPVYNLFNGLVSGHVLKHIVSGLALCLFFPNALSNKTS